MTFDSRIILSSRTDKTFGEFEAEMFVVVNKKEYEEAVAKEGTAEGEPEGEDGDGAAHQDMVEKAIEETFASGRIGALKIEPESLVTKSPSTKKIKIFILIHLMSFLSHVRAIVSNNNSMLIY